VVLDEQSSVVAMMAGRGLQGRKSIPIRNITSVQVKRASFFSPGYINFSYLGGKEFKGGLLEATRDPDTLIFNAARNDEVAAFAAEIERRRAELLASPAHTQSPMTWRSSLSCGRAAPLLMKSFLRRSAKLLGWVEAVAAGRTSIGDELEARPTSA